MRSESDMRLETGDDRYGFDRFREADAGFGCGEIEVKKYKGILNSMMFIGVRKPLASCSRIT